MQISGHFPPFLFSSVTLKPSRVAGGKPITISGEILRLPPIVPTFKKDGTVSQ